MALEAHVTTEAGYPIQVGETFEGTDRNGQPYIDRVVSVVELESPSPTKRNFRIELERVLHEES